MLCLAEGVSRPLMQHPYLAQFQADLYGYRMALQLRCDALAALRATETMIEHFENMGFANTAHMDLLNRARDELADFLTFADHLVGQATESLNNWVQRSGWLTRYLVP